MRISTSQMFTQGLGSIQDLQQKVMDSQLGLTTGKKINKPSDSPSDFAQITSLNRTMASIEQYAKNGDYAKTQLSISETALINATDSLQRARELAIQMSNDTYNTENRQQTSAEIEQIITELASFMNTNNSQGDKLFAGSSVNVDQAFIEDPSNPGYYTYIGNANAGAVYEEEANYGSRYVQIGFDANNSLQAGIQNDASRVATTDVGSTVFATDGTSLAAGLDNNILNVLVEFKNSLDAGNPPSSEVINDISSSITQMNLTRSEIGSRQNRIEAQYDAGESFKLVILERKEKLESQDIVEGVTTLTQSQNALQMAQQVFTRVQNMSIFNYLN